MRARRVVPLLPKKAKRGIARSLMDAWSSGTAKGDHNGLPSTSMGPWPGAYRPAARCSQPGNGQRSGRGTCCRNWSRRVADRPRTVAGERSGLSERQPPAAAATFLAAAPTSLLNLGRYHLSFADVRGTRLFAYKRGRVTRPTTGGGACELTPRSTRALRPGNLVPRRT